MPGYQISATVQHSAITRKFQVPTNFTFAKFEQAFKIIFGLTESLPAHFFIPKTNTIIVDKNLDENFRGIQPPTVKIIHTGAKLSTHLKHGPIKLIYTTENNGEIIIDVVPEKVLDHFDQEFPVVISAKKFIVGMDKPDLQKMNGALELAFSKIAQYKQKIQELEVHIAQVLDETADVKKDEELRKANKPIVFPVTFLLFFGPDLLPIPGETPADKEIDEDYINSNPTIQVTLLARHSEIINPEGGKDGFKLRNKKMTIINNLNFELAKRHMEKIWMDMGGVNLMPIQDLLDDLYQTLEKKLLVPEKIELFDIQVSGSWPAYNPAEEYSYMARDFVSYSRFRI